jgi:alkanesulfonate monooxygenase SsuD/methylene tetrahydromethanopterin reductase-like flavin-dependent oxidoreductase (luciferase family)
MDVGVGVPNMVPDVPRELLLDWATRAEAGGFSSLSTGERLTFSNNDVMISLSMAAAVTSRIRLMTSVLVLPLHGIGVVAKQAASIDVLSGGRFVLGVGTGGHPADYGFAPVTWRGRTPAFVGQLTRLREIWDGTGPPEERIGPRPAAGRPELLIGPSSEAAARRAHLADGVLTFAMEPDPAAQVALYDVARGAWAEHGKPGRPRFVAGLFFALGPAAGDRALDALNRYYSSFPPEQAALIAKSVTTTSEEAVSSALRRFAEAGADELIMCPLISELDQVDRLADLIAGLS